MKKVLLLLLAITPIAAMVATSTMPRARPLTFYLFRFDLRLRDNPALVAAAKDSAGGYLVRKASFFLCMYIYSMIVFSVAFSHSERNAKIGPCLLLRPGGHQSHALRLAEVQRQQIKVPH